jgi:hypothetical protein
MNIEMIEKVVGGVVGGGRKRPMNPHSKSPSVPHAMPHISLPVAHR